MFAASRYGAILLPSAPGAVSDLAHNQDLAQILRHFVDEKSELPSFSFQFPPVLTNVLELERKASCSICDFVFLHSELICAVGLGVAALASAMKEDKSWSLSKYSLTGVSFASVSHVKTKSSRLEVDYFPRQGSCCSCRELAEVSVHRRRKDRLSLQKWNANNAHPCGHSRSRTPCGVTVPSLDFVLQASVRELARTAYFGSLSIIPEDFIKENCAQFSCMFLGVHFLCKLCFTVLEQCCY